mgnify:CR=1 FL=1
MPLPLSWPDSLTQIEHSQEIGISVENLFTPHLFSRNHGLVPTTLTAEQIVELTARSDSLAAQVIGESLSDIAISAAPQAVSGQDELNNLPIEGLLVGETSTEDLNIVSRGSTQSFFEDLTDEDSFYNLPYPFDLRLDDSSRPELTGFPIWDQHPVIRDLRQIAADHVGFSTLSSGYFRFNRPLANLNPEDIIPAEQQSPILLVDVDPDSPERGRLYPTIASTPLPDGIY